MHHRSQLFAIVASLALASCAIEDPGAGLGVEQDSVLTMTRQHDHIVTDAAVAVAAWGPNRRDYFYTDPSTHGLIHYWSNNSGWDLYGPDPLGGYFVGAPAAISWGYGRIDIVGRSSDNNLLHKVYDANYGGWQALQTVYAGGAVRGTPALASWGTHRLDLFYRNASDGIDHRWFNGTFATDWVPATESLGGIVATDPSATSWGYNRIDIVAGARDGFSIGMSHRAYDPACGGWCGWDNNGIQSGVAGDVTTAPAIISTGPNNLELFWIRANIYGNRFIEHNSWNGSAWTWMDDNGFYQFVKGITAVAPVGWPVPDVVRTDGWNLDEEQWEL